MTFNRAENEKLVEKARDDAMAVPIEVLNAFARTAGITNLDEEQLRGLYFLYLIEKQDSTLMVNFMEYLADQKEGADFYIRVVEGGYTYKEILKEIMDRDPDWLGYMEGVFYDLVTKDRESDEPVYEYDEANWEEVTFQLGEETALNGILRKLVAKILLGPDIPGITGSAELNYNDPLWMGGHLRENSNNMGPNGIFNAVFTVSVGEPLCDMLVDKNFLNEMAPDENIARANLVTCMLLSDITSIIFHHLDYFNVPFVTHYNGLPE